MTLVAIRLLESDPSLMFTAQRMITRTKMTTFIIRRMNSRIIHGRIGQCLSFKNYERYFNAHILSSLRLKYFRAFYNIYQLTFPVPINASIIATKKIQQVTTIPMKMSLMSIIKMIGFVFNFQYGLEKEKNLSIYRNYG